MNENVYVKKVDSFLNSKYELSESGVEATTTLGFEQDSLEAVNMLELADISFVKPLRTILEVRVKPRFCP